MSTWKKNTEGRQYRLKDIWAGRFHSHPGKLLNGGGGLEGMLKGQKTRETAVENICYTAGKSESGPCDLSWGDVYEQKDWTVQKRMERKALTLLHIVPVSVTLQQLQSFPAKNTLTGFSCSLNFHKAYSSDRKILKWPVPCEPLHEKWALWAFLFFNAISDTHFLNT